MPRAVRDDIHALEALDAFIDNDLHGGPDPHVAQQAVVVFRVDRFELPVLHAGGGVFEGTTDGADEVAVGERRFGDAAAEVARGAEDEPYELFGGAEGAGGFGVWREGQL